MILDLNEYQDKAGVTAVYPMQGKNLVYCAIALSGEAGEFTNKIKKLMRSYGLGIGTSLEELIMKPKSRKLVEGLIGELGDILWYVAMAARELNVSLDVIAEANIHKLSQRKINNTIEGEGDGNRS